MYKRAFQETVNPKKSGTKERKKNAESNKGRPNLAAEYGVSGFSVNRRFQGREKIQIRKVINK